MRTKLVNKKINGYSLRLWPDCQALKTKAATPTNRRIKSSTIPILMTIVRKPINPMTCFRSAMISASIANTLPSHPAVFTKNDILTPLPIHGCNTRKSCTHAGTMRNKNIITLSHRFFHDLEPVLPMRPSDSSKNEVSNLSS